jgi:prepilin-type processing-associated H-X9-DG protein
MSLHLHGIGTAVPRHFIEQGDAAVVARTVCAPSRAQQQVLARLYQRSGVRTRHSVVLQGSTNGVPARQAFYIPATESDDPGPSTAERMQIYEESAEVLGASAAAAALANADSTPREVTHLVTISCTGFHSPGVDVALVRELGLNPGVARTHVGFMGCHAALNGLRVAKAFTDSDPEACVLMCAVELCSLHYQYGWHPDRIVSNALFADGAAAVVARGRAGANPGWQLNSSASAVVPETEEAMRWHIRDHGFEMTLSAKVPELIQQTLRPWIENWLAGAGLSLEDVASWAIHPGGPRILAACREACGLDETDLQASADVLAEFGNMSSPTVLFILERLRRTGAAGPCVALAFGPGLTIEAALLA